MFGYSCWPSTNRTRFSCSVHTFLVTVSKVECQKPPLSIRLLVLSSSPFLHCSRNMSQQMGDGHRRFLQMMMGCAVVTGREAASLHRYCCEAHKSESVRICPTSVNLHYKTNISNLQQHAHAEKAFGLYFLDGLFNVFYSCFVILRRLNGLNTIHTCYDDTFCLLA